MEKPLAESLVEKNLIGVDTEVSIFRKTKGFGDYAFTKDGVCVIEEIRRKRNGELIFLIGDGTTNRLWVDAYGIRLIDGMEPVLFAQAYQLDAWGNRFSLGRKRGRKTKAELIALMLIEMLEQGRLDRRETIIDIISDDGAEVEQTHLLDLIVDEDPPCMELRRLDVQGEVVLAETTQIVRIGSDCITTLLEDFKERRRQLRNAKEFDGRDYQYRRGSTCQTERTAV